MSEDQESQVATNPFSGVSKDIQDFSGSFSSKNNSMQASAGRQGSSAAELPTLQEDAPPGVFGS